MCVRMDHMSDDAGKTQALCAHTPSSPLLLLLFLLSPGSSLIPVKPGPGARGRPPNPSHFSPSHPLHPPHPSPLHRTLTRHSSSPLHLNHRTCHPPPPTHIHNHPCPPSLTPPHSSTSCLVPASLTQSA